ncbi:phage GP46 family protein [Jiella pelagia]|uniref:Phage GP46 family protein n=1 Tax=Jiella pelagia TaxID=2986949 RepID=A0ABY7C1X4_9HYPH|nr:phage GP46 family protein [Jiella pelagia]WAP69034.1 phage GP46 family protein [Jiella pelagia]
MDVLIQQSGTGYDIGLIGNDLAADQGLETAVLASLFSDGRSADGERGWWPDSAADRFGSVLWTLGRAKITSETVRRVEECAREGLLWLIAEGIAGTVTASAVRDGLYRINLSIIITRGADQKYDSLWRGVAAMNEARASGDTSILTVQYGMNMLLDLSGETIKTI